MPDFQNFSITRGNNVSLSVPVWTIEGKITNSQNGSVIQDFTGANAVKFPQILGQLTIDQQNQFVEEIIQILIHRKFGTG